MSAVKIVYQGDMRRVSLPEEQPFAFLKKEAIRLLQDDFKYGIVVRYKDDENDIVTISTDGELFEAIDSTKGTLKLLISTRNPTDSEGEFVKVSKDGRAVVLSKSAIDEKKNLKKVEAKAPPAKAREDAETTPSNVGSKKTKALDAKAKAKVSKKDQVEDEKHYSMCFVSDVTIPDFSEQVCGGLITKTWRIKNNGKLTWPAGVKLTGTGTEFKVIDKLPVPVLSPGKEGDVSIVLRVPRKPGNHRSQVFQLSFKGKKLQGDKLWAVVKAKAKTPRKQPVKATPKKETPIDNSQLNAKFVEDVSFPDGTKVESGTKVEKQWLIQNTGSAVWPEGTELVKITPKGLRACRGKVPLLAPGEKGVVSVVLNPPKKNGMFKTRDFSLSFDGKVFGEKYWAQLQVIEQKKVDMEAKRAEKKAAKAEKEALKAEKEKLKQLRVSQKEAAKADKEAKRAEKAKRKEVRDLKKKLNAKFIADVTIPDGFETETGQILQKTWKIQNDGDVTWPEGTNMVNWIGKGINRKVECKVPLLKPGETGCITVPFEVPNKTGKVKSTHYSLQYDGKKFGDNYWIVLKVKGNSPKKGIKKVINKDSKQIYGAQFVRDVNIADGTVVRPGQVLVKGWILKNSGNCVIPAGSKLVCLKRASTFGKDAETKMSQGVKPGDHFPITVKVTAPNTPGEYTAQFRMETADGKRFGDKYWVTIRVSPFPVPTDFKAMAMNFLADSKVVRTLQAELPDIIMEIRQGKKMAAIVASLIKKYPSFDKHPFVAMLKPYLKTLESFMGDQIAALLKMSSLMPVHK